MNLVCQRLGKKENSKHSLVTCGLEGLEKNKVIIKLIKVDPPRSSSVRSEFGEVGRRRGEMTSSGFALAETAKRDPCIKCLLLVLILIFASLLIVFSIVYFRGLSNEEISHECQCPKLEENSLTNWSIGAERIAFTCFPDYFLDEGSKISFSTCKGGLWVPPPPSCNILPLFLKCEIKKDGFRGVVQVWQNDTKHETQVEGIIDFSRARDKGHENISVQIGKKDCASSTLYEKLNETLYNSTHSLSIQFKSHQIVAYKGAELKATFIFINETSTAKIVYLKQENVTLIMKNPLFKK